MHLQTLADPVLVDATPEKEASARTPDELRDLQYRLNNAHYDVDYYLRQRRWDASALIKEINRELIESLGDMSLAINNKVEAVMEAIVFRRQRLGRNNPCLAAVERALHTFAREAGYGLTACAEEIYVDLRITAQDNFYPTANYVQRRSTQGQHKVINEISINNPVTELEDIVENLEVRLADGWHEWEYYGQPQLLFELNDVRRFGDNIVHYLQSCIATVERGFYSRANRLRGHSTICI